MRYLIIFSLIIMMSCSTSKISFIKQDNPKIVTKEYHLSPYKKIILNSFANVFIKFGDEEKIIVETDSNLIDILKPSVTYKGLIIPEAKLYSPTALNYYITLKKLKEVEMNGSGDLYLKNKIASSAFDLTINGSGDFQASDVDFLNLNVLINGSGDVRFAGKTAKVNIKTTGSGNFYGSDLYSDYVKINSQGSGDIRIYADKKFIAKIEDSGDIYLSGNPNYYELNKNGSGDIINFDE